MAWCLVNTPAHAQDGIWDRDHIARGILTSGIEDREPVDDLGTETVHPGNAEWRVYFFTQVLQQNDMEIAHLWFHGGELVAEVALPIGSENWRTYSSKVIRPQDSGDWRVLVVNSEQEMLLEYNFYVAGSE